MEINDAVVAFKEFIRWMRTLNSNELDKLRDAFPDCWSSVSKRARLRVKAEQFIKWACDSPSTERLLQIKARASQLLPDRYADYLLPRPLVSRSLCIILLMLLATWLVRAAIVNLPPGVPNYRGTDQTAGSQKFDSNGPKTSAHVVVGPLSELVNVEPKYRHVHSMFVRAEKLSMSESSDLVKEMDELLDSLQKQIRMEHDDFSQRVLVSAIRLLKEARYLEIREKSERLLAHLELTDDPPGIKNSVRRVRSDVREDWWPWDRADRSNRK